MTATFDTFQGQTVQYCGATLHFYKAKTYTFSKRKYVAFHYRPLEEIKQETKEPIIPTMAPTFPINSKLN